VTAFETLDVRDHKQWRKWLAEHHDSASEVWLVFYKRHTGVTCLSYEDAVEEALCYGWVDSLIRRVDEDRFARKFTPRKADSKWSTSNRRRYAELKARGRLSPAGEQRAPSARDGDAPRPATTPTYIVAALRANALAWACFEKLAPSHRRQYVAWIDSAKRRETKERRLNAAIGMLVEGKRIGLK